MAHSQLVNNSVDWEQGNDVKTNRLRSSSDSGCEKVDDNSLKNARNRSIIRLANLNINLCR